MRRIAIFTLLLGALVLGLSAFHPLAAQDATVQENNATVIQQLTDDFLNSGKLYVLDKLYSSHAIHHSPLGDLNVEARKMTRAALGQAIPDFHVTIDSLTTNGDWVAVLYTFTGTFTGELPTSDGKTVPGNDAKIKLSIGDFFRLDKDGHIAESWETYDNLNLLTQMGMMPKSGS